MDGSNVQEYFLYIRFGSWNLELLQLSVGLSPKLEESDFSTNPLHLFKKNQYFFKFPSYYL